MCNAWNHPAGCTCGWGGEGHLGSSGYGGSDIGTLHALLRSAVPVYETGLGRLDSFTNPNASCPVCGASVFFYRSPDGGRVFFDELGPPWPKHPCTDNLERVPLRSESVSDRRYGWQEESWSPVVGFELRKVRSNVYEIVSGSGYSGFFCSNSARLHKPQPAFVCFRERLGETEANMFWFDKGARSFVLSASIDEALRRPQGKA